tara:strand:+ start:55531 stop:59199 length:3669 start_codon:yes stop_codon:yes gene_type:complete
MNPERRLQSTLIRIATCAVMLAVAAVGQGADDHQFVPINTQPDHESPLPAREAIKHLAVPDGFQITLAASEPDVQQPIAIAFDDRGRLWVAESYSYDGSTFTDETDDRILIFEDTNGDGVLDRRKVFCDGLTHLTGLQIGFGGVWITSPPHLSFIPDRNSDDVPDGDAIVHLDGWSLKAEHNSVNGLTWGPDGWLYGRHGVKQPSSVGRPGTPAEARVDLSCCIWRFHPTRHVFEVVADGTINPWGLDFDDHGQGFLTTSVVDHLWHLVPGAHYERWKDRNVLPSPYVYEAMSATCDHLHWGSGTYDKASRQAEGNLDFGGGHSHCDAMIYLGDRWPQKYRGSLFCSNIHGRRINRDRFVRDAGIYRAEHDDDFLVSTDPWFRAVSMEYGPDGDVYMTDWSDNGECHDRDGVHRTSGRIYKITWGDPVATKVDLANASSRQLVDCQLNENDWYVRHARRVLQERAAVGDDMSDVRKQLRKMFESNDDVTRKLRALWTLYSIDGIDESFLVEQLDHSNEHVRAWSIRLLVDQGVPPSGVMAKFADLAQSDPSWLVQMSLASALSRVPAGDRWDTAANLAVATAVRDAPNLQRMIWYAIEPAVVSDASRAMQLVESVSPQMRRWISRRITEDGMPSVAVIFDALDRAKDPSLITDVLDGFNDALFTVKVDQLPPSANRLVRRLIEDEASGVRVSAMTTAAAIGDAHVLQRVREQLHRGSVDLPTRHAALTGLMRRKPPGFADDLQRLLPVDDLAGLALQAASTINDRELQQAIVARFPSFRKSDRGAAIDCLVSRKPSASLLIDAIEQKVIKPTELSAGQARQIVALDDADLLSRLEQVWGSARPSSKDRLQQIKMWKRALDPSRIAKANLTNGHRLFQKTCGTCHKLFGEGHSIGPDLTGANRRNLTYMLTSVIDPSAAVPADFQLTNVLTVDGRVISGVVTQQSEAMITMQTATESIQISPDDIETLKVSSQSMMPDGLLEKLSETQVQDLFAWMMGDGSLHATSQESATEPLPTVVLLGDSIRMGYQEKVATDLQGQASVWTPQENGRDTVHTLSRLEEWLGERDASIVHINVGLHDMLIGTKTGKPKHDIDQYAANLRKIFAKMRSLTDAPIIFALTTPVDEQRQASSETYHRIVRRNPDVVRYNAKAAEIAAEFGITVNDLHAVALSIGVDEAIRDDGVHLSPAGVDVIGQHIAELVSSAINASNAIPQHPRSENTPQG